VLVGLGALVAAAPAQPAAGPADAPLAASAAGIPWSDATGSGVAVATFGHLGCVALGPDGQCTSGNWPALAGAQWIWKQPKLTRFEARHGTGRVTFTVALTVPAELAGPALLRIDADDRYHAYVNGVLVAAQSHFDDTIDSIPVTLGEGASTLTVNVSGNAIPKSRPKTNPAGVIFRLDHCPAEGCVT
jgi:hypothetical protein